MACPEFNVGMLLLGRMGEDEVVNVRGCRRFSTYSGYQHTYNCTGSLVAEAASPVVLHDVLTLDACTTQHFRRDRQLRDLRKAFASFAALGPRKKLLAAISSSACYAGHAPAAPEPPCCTRAVLKGLLRCAELC